MSDIINYESIDKENSAVVTAAETLAVSDRVEYALAGEFLKKIKEVKGKVTEALEPNVKRWYEGHKKAKAEFNERMKPLDDAERIVKSKMQTFFAAEEKKRQDEEREKKAREEELEREKEEKAKALLDQGEFKKAEAVLNATEVLPEVQDKVKAQGVSMVKNWKFRIINPGLVPDQYKIIDEKAIGQVVRGLKERASIPGVEVYFEYGAKA